ncbi:DNA-directed RNA polymerase subunit [Aphelenchoides bicaudatus]|nr:DNA-directed RNA polymerase subunit [Aphelenchoides bicaudatus]
MGTFDLKPYAAPFMEFEKLTFRCYTNEEIEKLSVMRVTKTQSFDLAGYPVRNGLYDPAFGPLDMYENCETCGLSQLYCPGHYGHIKLSLPVFNPLLFPLVLEITKGSCFYCHRFTGSSSGPEAKILVAQLECIDRGFLSAAEIIQAKVNKVFENRTDEAKGSRRKVQLLNQEEEKVIINQITDIVHEIVADHNFQNEKAKPVKNTFKLRDGLVRDFLKNYLLKKKVNCPHCKNRLGTIRNDGGRAILLDIGVKSTGRQAGTKVSRRSAVAEDEKKVDIKTPSTLDKQFLLDQVKNEDFLDKQLQQVIAGSCTKLAWRAREIREHFRRLWKNEQHIIRVVYPMFEKLSQNLNDNQCPMDMLFMETILIPPSKFRPIRVLKEQRFESPSTVNYRKLLESDEVLRLLYQNENHLMQADVAALLKSRTFGKNIDEQIYNTYTLMQSQMNALYDQDAIPNNNVSGIRQGLFRMNMMGKRVNFACRSVITPDPYLDVDEIGIPEIFAKKLSFAEPFNFFNAKDLRKRTKNGSDIHPGANFVQEVGKPKEILFKALQRKSAARLLNVGNSEVLRQPTVVHRHLDRGDMILMNRQPTLHRPSIMGHKARILKAYNADFDGDEMNGHFVQSYLGQVEAAELVGVGHNYLVPKDGTPILGLIQDHVVSGVLMTLRGRFFNKEDFMHLLLASFGIPTARLKIPPPAMLKPKTLWTGKQIITALIDNCIPEGLPKINLVTKSKTPITCWTVKGAPKPQFLMSESEVVFRQGELLVGVMDKNHYGATQFGLIHCCFELYGPKVAIKILSGFSRLFPRYLQWHGFTLGVADILVNEEADQKRRDSIKALRSTGPEIVRKTFNLDEDATALKMKHCIATAYNNPRKDLTDSKMLDFNVKQTVAKYTDEINKACVPNGLIRSFPNNALQMMIQSGAKGSMVNGIQISCALGQIELEGQRPPLSAVGRTLPSFRCFDPSPRAGGFVDQRFLTGINPQELFFHTMAGREGLIDTAVKTSRSGYLQRCIIKHLEGIVVAYDLTVRDHDGGVVQFRYGEDGMDVGKSTYLSGEKYEFMKENQQALKNVVRPEGVRDSDWGLADAKSHFRRINRCRRKISNKGVSKGGFADFTRFQDDNRLDKDALIQLWRNLTEEDRLELNPRRLPDSVDVTFHPINTLGALPEKLLESIQSYIKSSNAGPEFESILFWKGIQSFCEPGENVGLLAAQSIGEPSTQMTLNTFHFAGRGEMNVTLGIPRLREILMTSGGNISTPMVEITVRSETTDEQLEALKREFTPVLLKDVLKEFVVEEKLILHQSISSRQYSVTMRLKRNENREAYARHLKRKSILDRIEKNVLPVIAEQLAKNYKDTLELDHLHHHKLKQTNQAILSKKGEDDGDEPTQTNQSKERADDGESSDEEAVGGDEADASENRLNKRHKDDGAEYEGEEEEIAHKDEVGIVDGDDIGLQDDLPSDDDSEVEDEEDLERAKSPMFDVNTERDRISQVVKSHAQICGYKYDSKNYRWCTVFYELPLKTKTKLNVSGITQRVVETAVVWKTKNIDKCVIREEKRGNETIRILQTQKINIEAIYKHAELLDVNTLYSNDVTMMLRFYGIEACTRVIVKEMNNVFGVYGIEVNPRHLTLVADHMTNTGSIQPFSRGAMNINASPLQKMTYETTLKFMRDAIVRDDIDYLDSPSARLVTGQTVQSGTGYFDLLMDGNSYTTK